MNRDASNRDKYERDAYLKDIEDTHFLDVDSGIYKPKSCRTETRNENEKRGTSPSTPLFVHPSTDGMMLTISFFSAIVAFATFLTVFAYTWIASRQLEQMTVATQATQTAAIAAKNATKNSEAFFLTEQRPYMVVDENNPEFVDIPPSAKKPVMVNVYLKNIGKTPAVQVVSQVHFFPSRQKLLSELTLGEQKQASREWVSLIESKFVNMRTNNDKARNELKALAKYSPGRDLPPGQRTLITPEESFDMKDADIPLLISQRLQFVIVGYTTYADSHGALYVTEYCYQFVGPFPKIWHICDSHNRNR